MALASTPPTRKVMIVWTHDVCCLRSNWSNDSGATWQVADALVSSCTCAGLDIPGCPPIKDETDATFSLGADLAVGTGGKIYALYGSMLGSGTASVYVNEHTTAWGTGVPLSAPGATLADKGFFPTPRPDIQASGSYVFATWMQSSLGNEQAFDVAARWSTDGGGTWLPAGGAASVPGKPPITPGEAESRAGFPACLLTPPTAVVAWDDRLQWTPPDFNATGPIFPGGVVVPLGAPETYVNSVYLDVGINP